MAFPVQQFILLLTRADFLTIAKVDTLISKRLSVENEAKLSQLETQNTSSAVLFIYNFQLREFRFVDTIRLALQV